MSMTPDQAAAELRTGAQIDVVLDVAEQALALAIPHLFRHVDPTAVDGKGALARFRRLCDNAGLPHDHTAFAGWIAIRALRPAAGDPVIGSFGCAVSDALLHALQPAMGTAGGILIGMSYGPDAVFVIPNSAATGRTDTIVTPSGTVVLPGSGVDSRAGTLASALAGAEQAAAGLGRRAYDADPDATIELDWTRPERTLSVDADSIHEDWTPEIATHPDLRTHPSALIQSATLATVEPPKATYRPRLPRRVIQSGRISAPQFDFLVAAGEAHSRHLPGNPDKPGEARKRVGIYLADGTGAGKTNEMLGIVLDNILRGRRKSVLVVAKRRHLPGFVEGWASFGRSRDDFIRLWDYKADQQIPATHGILVVTYTQLREMDANAGFLRVRQIADWVGYDFDGPMLFDEAQEMRNVAGNEDHSGKSSQISIQGLGGVALQDDLPDARVVYGSATGATDVHNLAYATRLGLWGEGTPFKTRNDFIAVFEKGGIADLEQVTLSLKASGVYIARSLSFDGVDVQHLPITLTDDERIVYNEAATLWTELHAAFKAAAKMCNSPYGDAERIADMRKRGLRGGIPYSHLTSVFEANRKVSMSTLIAAFKARGVIADMEKRIADGHSIVIQMQNTYEAQLSRALDKLEDPDDIRLQPAELINFAEQIPVHRYKVEQRRDPKSKVLYDVYSPDLDADGNQVLDPNAVALRDRMVAKAKQIRLPLPPLDQIILAFGPARVAEVTGRGRRLAPDKPYGRRDGASGVVIEERTETDRLDDIAAFHDARKPILIFSTGAGGSSLSYHARIGTKAAGNRRIHYLIQLGHRADEVTQGIGRTHRSDQASAPIVSLVSVNLPADMLYASRIVSALFKLGALTQGHRHASTNGMFDERDCMDGPYAERAWDDLQQAIADGLVDGYDWPRFMQDMGLSLAGEVEVSKWGKMVSVGVLTNVNSMINRVAALTDRRQQIIFDALRGFIDKRIEQAIAEGVFNAGPETLKATSLRILTDRRAPTDLIHGGSTRLLRIRKTTEVTPVPFGEAFRRYLAERRGLFGADFRKHHTTGDVALMAPGKPIFTALGDRIATIDVITPLGTTNRPARLVQREPWTPAASMEKIEAAWNAKIESAPKESVSYVTIVADALLPVWPVLNSASGARTAVYRLATDEGMQIVGRPISAAVYPDFCAAIDITARPDQLEVDEIMGHLKAGSSIALAAHSNAPHMLRAEWSRGQITGLSIEISTGVNAAFSAVLDSLPGASPSRRAGTTCQITSRPRDVADVLAAILSCAPALHVVEDPLAVGAAPKPKASAKAAKASAAAAQALLAA